MFLLDSIKVLFLMNINIYFDRVFLNNILNEILYRGD